MHTSCNKFQIRMCQDLVKAANTYSKVRREYPLELIRRFNLSGKMLFAQNFNPEITWVCLIYHSIVFMSIVKINQVIYLGMSSNGVHLNTYCIKLHYFGWGIVQKSLTLNTPHLHSKIIICIHHWLNRTFQKPECYAFCHGKDGAPWLRTHIPQIRVISCPSSTTSQL